MKLCAAALVVVIAIAGCGSGAKTSAIPSGGGSTTSSSSTTATAAAPAPAGCKAVKQPQAKSIGHYKRPASRLDPAKTWTATVKTNCGTFAFRLDVKNAP